MTFTVVQLRNVMKKPAKMAKQAERKGLSPVCHRGRLWVTVPPEKPYDQRNDKNHRQQWDYKQAQEKTEVDDWSGLADGFALNRGIWIAIKATPNGNCITRHAGFVVQLDTPTDRHAVSSDGSIDHDVA